MDFLFLTDIVSFDKIAVTNDIITASKFQPNLGSLNGFIASNDVRRAENRSPIPTSPQSWWPQILSKKLFFSSKDLSSLPDLPPSAICGLKHNDDLSNLTAFNDNPTHHGQP